MLTRQVDINPSAFIFIILTKSYHTLKNFITYLIKAKGRHSIHSPFVYDLYESCIVNPKKPSYHHRIEKQRRKLISNNSTIIINDLGAGSNIEKSNKRKINQIAKHSTKSSKDAQFIACFAKKINATNIIELGSSFALTTARIALANPSAKIYSVEGCNNIANIAKSNLEELNIDNVNIMVGNFDEIFPDLLQKIKADLIFIDGNHTKKSTLHYFNLALEKINPQSFIIFDDIYWSQGMTEAWNTIIENPRVSISINLFHFGIVSINSDFSKQDFVLKY